MDNISAKIIELASGVYVIPGNTNVGVIISGDSTEKEIYLVDSGCTEIDAEYILDVLTAFFEQQGCTFKLVGLLTTHSHPDHCGGHNYLKEHTGSLIYAAKGEQGAMETPIVQSAVLWGGYPPHELRTLYFKPAQTFVDKIISEKLEIDISGGRKINFIELLGHSNSSMGVIISDKRGKKVIFAGDAIFPRDEIGRYWIPLIINPDEFMQSLDKLCEIKNVDWCIPSHGDFLRKNINEAAELNKIAILSTRMCILNALESGKKMTADQLVKYVADKNYLEMTVSQFALISSTVRSYISVMHDAHEIKFEMKNNMLYFYKA